MIQRHRINPIFFLIGLVVSTSLFALPEDKQQRLNFESTSISYDYKKNKISYIGNVQAHQGTTQLHANEMLIFYNKQQQITKVIASGSPAHYLTLPAAKKGLLHAYANKIIYYPLLGRVELLEKGKIEQEGNEFTSDFIVFDMKKGRVTSRPLHSSNSKIILQPLNKAR